MATKLRPPKNAKPISRDQCPYKRHCEDSNVFRKTQWLMEIACPAAGVTCPRLINFLKNKIPVSYQTDPPGQMHRCVCGTNMSESHIIPTLDGLQLICSRCRKVLLVKPIHGLNGIVVTNDAAIEQQGPTNDLWTTWNYHDPDSEETSEYEAAEEFKSDDIYVPGRYAFFDTETSGTAGDDRVIEIGVVIVQDGKVVDEYGTLINSTSYIKSGAQQIHKITVEELKGQPKPIEVWPRILSMMDDARPVAHNASFDMRFMAHETQLLGLQMNLSAIDTLKLFRQKDPDLPNHQLKTLVDKYLGEFAGTEHRALDDARMLAQICLKSGVLYNEADNKEMKHAA